MKQSLSSPDAVAAPRFDTLDACYAWLEGHINHEHRLGRATYTDRDFALDAFRRRLAALGNPQDSAAAIHIAGSCGKGSTALLLEAVLHALGCRVATYTSPHFHEYRERIRLDGGIIDGPGFRRAIEAAASVPSADGGSFRTVFEYLTAAFFIAAREASVDWSIVETGLGGRLDATNALPPGPVLWTRIGLEHTQLLGPNPTAIAGEKAAILKPGGFAVAGRQQGLEAMEVFRRRGIETGSSVIEAERVLPLIEARHEADGMVLLFERDGRPFRLTLPLLGTFLADNLQGVIAMLDALAARGRLPRLTHDQLQTILGSVRLPGRMERVCSSPLVYADGGHCPPAARAVAETMAAHFPSGRAIAVVSLVEDKDLRGFFKELALWPGWRAVVLHRLATPRAASLEALAEAASGLFPRVEMRPDANEALEFAAHIAEKEERIIATGSMYGVGPVRRWGASHER